MINNKRFQIFISSTYLDLIDERQSVLKAVLELEHIPAGMELFPATDASAWDLIKSVIDESDYYVLIVGGKYGSLHPDGLGFTEMEYDYAVDQKKPVIALLHNSPDQIARGKTDIDEAQWKRLEKFREKVRKHHTCQFWTNAHDLKASVIVSLTSMFKRHPAVGWVRADSVPSGARIEDVLLLKERVAELEAQLNASRTMPAAGTDDLAQGDDEHTVETRIESRTHIFEPYPVVYSWDDLFANVAPALLNEASDQRLRMALHEYIKADALRLFNEDADIPKTDKAYPQCLVPESEKDTCIVQFRALGLIVESQRKRSVTDSGKYWALTPYGDHKLVQLRAMRRNAQDHQPRKG
ncbi:DUF4062 domain-containing protein [Variovorax sp. JS1663]|uniref:DUF4062 domain-containing protein n=1 Tax=Variovorax sp. JS1663 TaxID=1851577 RepID=UPI000B343A72|nr:DUF4062 domain-containing protein [Variovorax sp. JS1663]OUM02852.1 hypothetical protein A8M77_09665 [Variovorax sp. JS1663]